MESRKGTKMCNSALCSLQIDVLVRMNLIWLLVYQFSGFVTHLIEQIVLKVKSLNHIQK